MKFFDSERVNKNIYSERFYVISYLLFYLMHGSLYLKIFTQFYFVNFKRENVFPVKEMVVAR